VNGKSQLLGKVQCVIKSHYTMGDNFLYRFTKQQKLKVFYGQQCIYCLSSKRLFKNKNISGQVFQKNVFLHLCHNLSSNCRFVQAGLWYRRFSESTIDSIRMHSWNRTCLLYNWEIGSSKIRRAIRDNLKEK
jgi:hypothetical protein